MKCWKHNCLSMPKNVDQMLLYVAPHSPFNIQWTHLYFYIFNFILNFGLIHVLPLFFESLFAPIDTDTRLRINRKWALLAHIVNIIMALLQTNIICSLSLTHSLCVSFYLSPFFRIRFSRWLNPTKSQTHA